MMRRFVLTSFVLLVSSGASIYAAQDVEITYIAHACFVVESPSSGTRVIIDPFNGYTYDWLGYSFPDGQSADAVLVTHPHYDHDATYYIGGRPPIFRSPGTYAVHDVKIEGIEGKHAKDYGREFGQLNTIWSLQVGGIRIVHLGDNGPLTPENVERLGRVDVLMIPIDGDQHILRYDEVDAIVNALEPGIVVPMHYEIPALSEQPEDLGPIDSWLDGRENVRQLPNHRLTVSPSEIPDGPSVLVFRPSPEVKPWPSSYRSARAKIDQAERLFKTRPAEIEPLLREAVELFPRGLEFWFVLGGNLMINGRTDEAIDVLETGLLVAAKDDWIYQWRTRERLARLYEETGQEELAVSQYEEILDGCAVTELRERARKKLAELQ